MRWVTSGSSCAGCTSSRWRSSSAGSSSSPRSSCPSSAARRIARGCAFGNFHELTPILPSEWEAGIAGRYRELDVRAAEGTVEDIVALGEGHPRTTMLIARETLTVALARTQGRGIDFGDVRGGQELAMQADRLRHEEIVERLRSTAHAYSIALRVARGQRPYSGTTSSGARRALSMMERAGSAERHGRGDWVIPEPLLRSYLAARL